MSNFMQFGPMGSRLFRVGGGTDGRTDSHDGANSRFSQFKKNA